ncbi:MAG TPA: hypothetical protein VIX17_29505 [Pyrinomonadaceae bacterium]|jgi:hypothetical protein
MIPDSMPVNFWPILVPLIFLYLGGVWLLSRKSRTVAGAFLILTILCISILFLNLNVENRQTRNMSWKVYESSIGSVVSVEMTDSRDGFKTSLASVELAEHLKAAHKYVIPVEVVEWRDFGSLRAYRIEKIDGIDVANWVGASGR